MSPAPLASGHLKKMQVELGEPARYWLRLDDRRIELNPYLGKPVRLVYQGEIHCKHCGRATNKSFNQGYCYPCFQTLAECDSCILSPEKCHFHLDTCRDPRWGESHCMQDHMVYLANASGLKVGITRVSQLPTRWLDQGAVQALPILRVSTRYQSGLVETLFKREVSDRTRWQAMLKNQVECLDLPLERQRLFQQLDAPLAELERRFGLQAIQRLHDAEPVEIAYPVLNYPTKVTSLSLDKTPEVQGTLQGIKGQYLILDSGVINLRKFSAYKVEFYA